MWVAAPETVVEDHVGAVDTVDTVDCLGAASSSRDFLHWGHSNRLETMIGPVAVFAGQILIS